MAQRTGSAKPRDDTAVESPRRPVVMPQSYNGEGSWQDWKTSFDQCSALNQWTEQDKLQWLAVCLTGDAAWAFGQLTVEQRESYDSCIAGLTTLLVPPDVEQLNVTLFRTRRKSKNEDWFAFARELSKLAAKAYPAFAPGVRDTLSLERFLTELGPEDWASSVRRAHPSSLMDAVRMAIQQEATEQAYRGNVLRQAVNSARVHVGEVEEIAATVSRSNHPNRGQDSPGGYQRTESLDEVRALRNEIDEMKRMVQEMCLQISPLAARLQGGRLTNGPQALGRARCFNCGRRGHLIKDCPRLQTAERSPDHHGKSWNKSLDAYSVVNALSNANAGCGDTARMESAEESASASVGTCACVPVQVRNRCIRMLVDTGAERTLLRSDEFARIRGQWKLSPCNVRLLSAEGTALDVMGSVSLPLQVGDRTFDMEVIVVNALQFAGLLGIDFLKQHGFVVDLARGTLNSPKQKLRIPLQSAGRTSGNGAWSVSVGKPVSLSKRMLQQLVETTGVPLTASQRKKLHGMLSKFRNAFAASEFDIGRTSVLKHDIVTDNIRPVRHPLRRLAPVERKEVSQLIQRLLDNKIIEPSNSPWAAGIVPVRKKDGSLRLCVDYRKLNEVSRRDAYPIPRIDETLEALAGARYFSTIDLLSGYWQVELTEAAKEKTAFITHDGLFQFNVMPFGLTGAPATFQRLMEHVLAGLKWNTCLVYLDDIIVFSRTAEEHVEHLSQVLNRLQKAGLKPNASKCKLFCKEVRYLGHIVSEKGIEPDPSLTEKMRTYPVPTCLAEVKRFLGLASYYRKFIKDFAAIAKPLHQLTEKRKPFQWTPECTSAFQKLRTALLSEPILRLPDFDASFILDTDASDTAIGAVLSQRDEHGREHPVAYASRTLTRAEQRYCVTRREMLAVITFTDQFRPYLQQKFTLRTDHGSLQWLRDFKNPDGQWARWQQKLQQYDFDIEHRAGSRHANADTLSRIPCKQCGRSGTEVMGVPVNVVALENLEEMRTSQLDDEDIAPILKAKAAGVVGQEIRCGKRSNSKNLLMLNWHRLAIQKGILVRKWFCDDQSGYRWQVVVPKRMIKPVLDQAHQQLTAGHLGIEKTIERIRERFYWPGYRSDTKKYVASCYECNTRNEPVEKGRAPLQPVVATRRWEKLAIDILGPLVVSETGNRYILVAIDCFSKFAEAFPIPDQEAKTVTRVLVNEFICRYGVPEAIHTDQGSQFEAAIFQSMCTELGIRKTRTTPYHPSGNGQVERMNRTLGTMLSKVVDENHRKWDEVLPKVMMAYRASIQSSTRMAPYTMVFGEQCRLPEDIYRPAEGKVQSPEEHATQLKKVLDKMYIVARRRLKVVRKLQKQQYDKSSRGRSFRKGSLVFLRSPRVARRGKCRKLTRPWTGPYRVLAKPSPVTYQIQHVRNRNDLQIVHFDRLKFCPKDIRIPTHQKRAHMRPKAVIPQGTQQVTEFRPTVVLEPDEQPRKMKDLEQGHIAARRPRRRIQLPSRYRDYIVDLPGHSHV
uniref:RNA-directed DNA polymerase n=2 Tax=Trichuris muris TaxID=70415 RepID=A0A5S6Q2I3_TRIMR